MDVNDWLLDEPSPGEVANATFQIVRRGYDPLEVQAFARAVGAELQRLAAENQELKESLTQAKNQVTAEINEETITEYLGQETTRLLQAARDTSAGVVRRAENKANEMVDEASDEAQRIRAEATVEATAERRRAQDESRRLVVEATSHRRAVLNELAGRRDLACKQLHELLSGRDVSVQSLAHVAANAGDLIGRLDAISADPEDFVNLDPAVESEKPAMDKDAVLKVTAGAPGSKGARGRASGPKPNKSSAPAVEEPIIELDEGAARAQG